MKYILALAIASACAYADGLQQLSELDFQYVQYSSMFNKHTRCVAEYQERMQEFGKTQAFITQFNAKLDTHFLGHNAYSDWTDAERLQYLSGGIVGNLKDHDHMQKHYARLNTEHIPKSINWFEQGAVNPVRHGLTTCASSWAHAAIDAIQGDIFIKTGKMEILSAQQLIDCDHSSWGCHGGLYTNAYEYAIHNSIMTEEDYPYTGVQQDCAYDEAKGVAQASSFINILPHDVNQLKMAVKLGPVATSISTNNKVFQFYKGGVISTSDCSKVDTPVDSAVTIVGYGHDDTLNQDYWLIKNSWGISWGEKGFARVSIKQDGPGVCNIQTESSVVFTI